MGTAGSCLGRFELDLLEFDEGSRGAGFKAMAIEIHQKDRRARSSNIVEIPAQNPST